MYRCHWLKLYEEGVVTSTDWRPNEVGFIISVVEGRKTMVIIDEDQPGTLNDDHEFIKFIENELDGQDVRYTLRRLNT